MSSASDRKTAFVFFIALAAIAASMAYTIYQLEVVKSVLVESLDNQEQMLENQATGLNRSKYTAAAAEDLLDRQSQIFTDQASSDVHQKTQIENSRIVIGLLYDIRSFLQNQTMSDP